MTCCSAGRGLHAEIGGWEVGSSYDIYTGRFVNVETDRPDNANIQQEYTIRLLDYDTPSPWPTWNVKFRTEDNGDGTITAYVTWDPDLLPGDAVTALFGGLPDDIEELGLSGSATVTLPDTVTQFVFGVERPSVTIYTEPLSLGEEFELEMGETPLRRVVIDNDEDTFTPIRSTQYEIQIHTSSNVNLGNFVDGGDTRWYCEIETEAEGIIFKGWLSLEDLSEDFMPHPNVLTLIATDGLGFLNDEPLVNFDGDTPQNEHPILNYLLWGLAKTGLSLPLKVNMNLRHETATPLVSDDSGDGHFFEFVHLDARTFEDEIGTCEDCYTVIEKILKDYCQLFQYKGQWVITAIDEQDASDRYFFTWNPDGTFVGQTFESFDKSVGVDLPLSFMNDDAIVKVRRSYRQIIERFNYRNWQEVICNIDFSRGITVISAPDLSAAESTGTYEVDCWQVRRILGQPVTSTIYIQREFEYGYEKERYLVITPMTTVNTPYDFAYPPPLVIEEEAKITVSFDFRFPSDFADGNVVYFPGVIYILDNDGNYWYWWNFDTPNDISTFDWYFRSAVDGEGNFYLPFDRSAAGDPDMSKWQSISVSLKPAPAGGEFYIGLLQLHQEAGSGDNQNAYYANLNVTYTPLINGSYNLYAGQTSTVTNEDLNTKALREEEVFISDAPHRNMKGALLRLVGDDYVLTSGFYQANVFTTGDPAQEFIQPYGYWQAYAVWNQFRRTMRIFEAVIDGTDSDTEIPDMIHKYRLTDIDLNTTNGSDQYRLFQLLHAEMDMHLCEWKAFLIEVFNTAQEKQFTGLEFKYISNND